MKRRRRMIGRSKQKIEQAGTIRARLTDGRLFPVSFTRLANEGSV